MTLFLAGGVLGLALAAAPGDVKLGPAERRYFGKQLEKVLSQLEVGLGAQGVRCALGVPRGEAVVPRRDDPAAWPSEGGKGTLYGYAPRSWQVMLDCTKPGVQPFRAALDLLPTPGVVPRAKVLRAGPGWAIRDLGSDTDGLLLGEFAILEAGAGVAPPKGPAQAPTLAVARLAMFAVEEGPGKPRAIDVLGALAPTALLEALQAAAALPAPATALQPYVPPKDLGRAPEASKAPEALTYEASSEPEPAPVKVVLEKGDEHGLGRLERVLSPAEHAYFTTLRAATVAAALRATAPLHCVYNASGHDRPDEAAEPGPDGYESTTRFADSLTCPQPGGPGLTLSLEARRRWAPGPHATVLGKQQLAPDATLQRLAATPALGEVELVVGEQSSPQGRETEVWLRPSLMRLGAVRLSALGEARALDDEEALLAKVDLAPLQALLKAPPPPPPPRAPAREGPRSDAPRGPVEREVYQAVLRLALERSVLVDTLSADTLGTGLPKVAAAVAPDLLPSALLDFNEVARSPGPLPAELAPGTRRISSAERQAFFSASKSEPRRDGWKAFRARFGNARIVTLTRVGLSADQTQAVVGVSWQADWLAGSGQLYFLRKTERGWEITYRLGRWVS